MADEPQGAAPAATQENAAAVSASEAGQNPGGFTEQDFAHPEWGPKAKNLQRLHEGSMARAKKAEDEHKADKEKLGIVARAFQQHPDIAKALRDRLDGKTQATPDEQPDDENEDEVKTLSRKVDQLMEKIAEGDRKHAADLALHAQYGSLGGGDPIKGQKLFQEQFEREANELVGTMREGGESQALALAMELLQNRRKPTQPPVAPEPSGSTTAEAGRGVVAPTPTKLPTTDGEILQAALKEAGFQDTGSYTVAQEKEMAEEVKEAEAGAPAKGA